MRSVSIKDIKVGDKVITPDGIANVVKTIDEYIPKRMFRMVFKEGKVDVSYNHLWTVFMNGNVEVFDTLTIFNSPNKDKFNFGEENGPKLLKIKEIKPSKVCCIEIDSKDKLFALDLPGGKLYTHNCQFRAACGRLGSIASMMLFGNTMATTIDGSHPGAGMISANGAISSIQYYYEDISWIQNFYKICGYDKEGHRPMKSSVSNAKATEEQNELDSFNEDLNGDKDNNSIKDVIGDEIEELDDIFNFEHDIAKIEIQGISGEVDKTKRQKFEI